MRYHIAPIYCRPWQLNGLSQRLIESHYENNYGGALNRLNAITEKLASLDFTATPGYLLNGLKREEFTALNSTLLHELYFASLGGDGRKLSPVITEAIVRDFGSVERWRAEYVAMAGALAGGSGWVLLTYLPRDRRLVNQSATDHGQSLAGGIPVLALDMYEHAYHLTSAPTRRLMSMHSCATSIGAPSQARYEDAFQVGPPRPLVQKEFADLPCIAVEDVKAMLDDGRACPDHRRPPQVLLHARPGHHGRCRMARPRAG